MTGIRQLLWSVLIRCARGASLLLVAPVSLLPLAAVAQSALVEAQPLATPLTVVAPAFPPNMSAPASGVRVDVVGTVLANGEIKPTSITADNEQRPFVDAVIDVLRWWRFVPAIDKQRCAPKDSESRFSIWFEGSAATPKIYFSFPKRETASDGGSNWVESIRAPKVEYPIDLLGVEGQVQVLYLVSPDGKVKSATVRSSTPYGAFDYPVLKAAWATRVTWKEPRPDADLCAERTYNFCEVEPRSVSVAFHECRSSK